MHDATYHEKAKHFPFFILVKENLFAFTTPFLYKELPEYSVHELRVLFLFRWRASCFIMYDNHFCYSFQTLIVYLYKYHHSRVFTIQRLQINELLQLNFSYIYKCILPKQKLLDFILLVGTYMELWCCHDFRTCSTTACSPPLLSGRK